jgi:hypothetical protein
VKRTHLLVLVVVSLSRIRNKITSPLERSLLLQMVENLGHHLINSSIHPSIHPSILKGKKKSKWA